jgi:hypothetical protein
LDRNCELKVPRSGAAWASAEAYCCSGLRERRAPCRRPSTSLSHPAWAKASAPALPSVVTASAATRAIWLAAALVMSSAIVSLSGGGRGAEGWVDEGESGNGETGER